MSELRLLPAVEKRVETGAVQFGDDWPGIFIRGDNALAFRVQFDELMRLFPPNTFTHSVVRELSILFGECDASLYPTPAVKEEEE